MGVVYKENKNFINKFKLLLEKEAKREKETVVVRVPFFINGVLLKAPILIEYKPEEVILEEVGKRLFFCTSIKVLNQYASNDYSSPQGDIDVRAFEVYASQFNKWSIPDDDVKKIKKFLADNQITKNSKGNFNIVDMDNYDIVTDLRINKDGYYSNIFKTHDDVKTIKSYIQQLEKADIDIQRLSCIYKSIKNPSVIPVAYIDSEAHGTLSIPEKYPTSRTSTSFYEKTSIDTPYTISGNMLQSLARNSINLTPFSYWTVFKFKGCGFIDDKKYMGINNYM